MAMTNQELEKRHPKITMRCPYKETLKDEARRAGYRKLTPYLTECLRRGRLELSGETQLTIFDTVLERR